MATERIPKEDLDGIEAVLQACVRRLFETPGIETQRLSEEAEQQLLSLVAARARHATSVALWGGDGVRPTMPPTGRANGFAASNLSGPLADIDDEPTVSR